MDNTTEDKELEPLKTAVLSALQSDGSLDEIRAQLRAHVFRVCDNIDDNKHCVQHITRATDDHLFVDQLIAEYLRLNGYKHSLSVFANESGQQKQSKFDRSSAQHKLGLRLKDDNQSKQLPLLTAIVKNCLKKTPKK
ncbi:unnamed protein product [Oppiella nova]|uniref:FGFR1 oncogene partner (FOP) N-terminal dimerisation domain-containing protein n=1 Tax=Oppiella nova TaxID=334625 RepID=A0A7R9MHL1_9ACAR|nr:unnamed protein product [Oppiella nova]CAG2177098.1 unnamed protein product [Oppiella nova]